MAQPTIRQLQVFERIARSQNFSHAARELHLTQPTVSVQMAQLQAIVGTPLFYPVGKRMQLTEAGEIMLATARSVLDSLETMRARLLALKGLDAGRLRLAVATSAKFFAPRLLGHFLQQHPAIEPSLTVTQREVLLSRMRDNLDDLYVFSVPPNAPDLAVEPFMPNELVAIAAHDHPLARRRGPISVAELCRHPFLQRESGSGTRILIERFFAEQGLAVQPRMELGSNFAIEQAVATGVGVSIVSRTMLDGLHLGDEIRVLDVEGLPLRGHWYLVYLKTKADLPVVKSFREFLGRFTQEPAAPAGNARKPRRAASRRP
ncbi:MAG: LysR family transcriptional regulator [Thiobacillus sp.]